MSTLQPEPPHLCVYALPGVPQDVALVECCRTLEEAGCTFSNEVVVTRSESPFRSITELEREMTSYDSTAERLVSEHRVLAMGFRHPRFGAVSLAVAPTVDARERHPLEVAVHAGGLSYPTALRSRDQKGDARRRWAWAKSLLVSMSERTGAAYGAAGVEVDFPSVHALRGTVGQRVLRPSTWFVPTSTSKDRAAQEESLWSALPQRSVVRVRDGVMIHGPDADGEGGADDEDVDQVVALLAHRMTDSA